MKWTPADQTDIRQTWVKHWPKQTQDAVYKRIQSHVEAGAQLDRSIRIVEHTKGKK